MASEYVNRRHEQIREEIKCRQREEESRTKSRDLAPDRFQKLKEQIRTDITDLGSPPDLIPVPLCTFEPHSSGFKLYKHTWPRTELIVTRQDNSTVIAIKKRIHIGQASLADESDYSITIETAKDAPHETCFRYDGKDIFEVPVVAGIILDLLLQAS